MSLATTVTAILTLFLCVVYVFASPDNQNYVLTLLFVSLIATIGGVNKSMFICMRCVQSCHVSEIPWWGNKCLAGLVEGKCFIESKSSVKDRRIWKTSEEK